MSQAISNEASTLLPCPLCAGEARVAKPYGIEAVICRDCHLTITDHDQQSAVTKWNRRDGVALRLGASPAVAEARKLRAELATLRAFKLPFFLKCTPEMDARGREAVELAKADGCASAWVLYQLYFETAAQVWLDEREDDQEQAAAGLLSSAQAVLEWTEVKHRPPVREEFPTGAMALVRVDALADLHDAIHGVQEACA